MKLSKAIGAALAALITTSTAQAGGDPDLLAELNNIDRARPGFASATSNLQALDNQTVVKPGRLTPVRISRSDVNMLECKAGPITDRTFSEEKPLIYKAGAGQEGSYGFVKLGQQLVGSETLYYTQPVELYITCGGSVYSLMLMPEAIPTQHIVLSPGRGNEMQKNIAMFSEMSLEQAALMLIDKVQYEPNLPLTFSVTKAGPSEKWQYVLPSVKVRLVKSIKPEGVGMIAHEYVAYAEEEALMKEFDFVSLRQNTFAVRMEQEQLRPRGTTRVYVIERLWR